MKTLLATTMAALTLVSGAAFAQTYKLGGTDEGVTLPPALRYHADQYGNRIVDAERPAAVAADEFDAQEQVFGLSAEMADERLAETERRYRTGDTDTGVVLHAPFRDRLYR